MPIIMNGTALAKKIREELKEKVGRYATSWHAPSLAVIKVGYDAASEVYVRNKIKACNEVGITSVVHEFAPDATQKSIENLIIQLNNNDDIHGILIQLPLPDHLDEKKLLNMITPTKDVDCFKDINLGKCLIGNGDIAPCTPAGIMALLDEYNIDLEGKHCVVIGRSNIVGKPIAMMLLARNATVTICHSKTKDLKSICKTADLIVSAVGKKGLITEDMIKKDVVIVDVGINRDENGKLCGDCDLKDSELPSYITPVPGGVGPMTVAMLMKNTFHNYRGF